MLAMAHANLTDPLVQLQIYMYLLLLSCFNLLRMFWSPLIVIYTAAVNFWSCCCGLEQDEAAAMICCYDLLWSFCRLWLAYIYLLVIFGTVAVIYILSSLIVQLHFMDDGYTHVQLHLMTTFLCLRILKCSPLQSTLRILERSLPCLLCRRSSTKQASFIVHIQIHDEVPGIYVHSTDRRVYNYRL